MRTFELDPRILHSALIGPHEKHAFFVDAACATSIHAHIEALPQGRGRPNPDWLLEVAENKAIKRTSRLAIHLLLLNVQVRNTTGTWGERRGSC